ncbi:MAG: hypothetical protein HF982_07895 [Desulfobacteraceae bacterium]|nr:hypothetical protein [Desulfobacteraceae bacterium]MBC2719492.1 hypothetical protein [Desulfobacteraceae bacterium]
MPAPQKDMLAQLAKSNFLSKGVELPMDWLEPGEQYSDAFTPSELMVSPNFPMNLFREATLNKYHVDAAATVGEQLADYIDGISGAICDGIDNWMKMTMIASVIINGPTGMLLPGGVVGPPLMPLILASAPMSTPQEIKYSNAIAGALGTLWQSWHMGLMGTLMYPAFAVFPGPMAPPTPNIPIPLVTFSSPGESGLSPGTLKSTMDANLADPEALHASDLFDAIANAFNTVFQIFKTSTLVQNVLGMGPIPSFAPPVVPAGPVVAGSVIPTPGVLK